jgi:hypothetical protein
MVRLCLPPPRSPTKEKSEESDMQMRSEIAAYMTAAVVMLGAAPAYAGVMISSFTAATDPLSSGSSQLLTVVLTVYDDSLASNTTMTSGSVHFDAGGGLGMATQSFGAVGTTATFTQSFVYTNPPGEFIFPKVDFSAKYSDIYLYGTPAASPESGLSATGSRGTVFIMGTPVTASVPEPLTLSFFSAGLAGAAAMRRKAKKA